MARTNPSSSRRRYGVPGTAPIVLLTAVLLTVLSACGGADAGGRVDPEQVDAVEPPELGACRLLTPEDVAEPSNATRTVDCSRRHTAQTYAVGEVPPEVAEAGYGSREVGAFAYETCSTKMRAFLGADESQAMRTILSWAWFRPTEDAWEEGARWYRCDLVGGVAQSRELVALPETAKGLLQGRPEDRWLVCAVGRTIPESTKVPCSSQHDWRAVTTIKLGEPEDPYPGDRVVEVRTRDYCSDSVGAWLNYPIDYDYGYTMFHEAEWKAGNRRSICWAKTSQ